MATSVLFVLYALSPQKIKKRTDYANIILDLSHQPTSFVQKWIHWRVWQYNAIKKRVPESTEGNNNSKSLHCPNYFCYVWEDTSDLITVTRGPSAQWTTMPGDDDCHPFCERIRSEARDGEVCSSSRLLFVSQPQNGDSLDDSTFYPSM